MIEIVGYVATLLAAAQFIPQVVRTTRSGDLAGVSSVMYAIMLAQSGAWLGYGVREGLVPAVLTNIMLATCGLLMMRLLVRNHAPRIHTAIVLIIVMLGIELLIFLFLPDAVLGIVAATLAFIMLWPQVILALQQTDLSGLSAASWYLSVVNTSLWVIYGIGRGAVLLWLSAGQALVLSLIILARMARLRQLEGARAPLV